MERAKRNGRLAVAALTVIGLGLIVFASVWGNGTPVPADGWSGGEQGRPATSGPPASTTPTPSSSPPRPSARAEEPTGGAQERGTLPPSPVRVEIPAIGVRSPLLLLGLAEDGTAEVPATGEADQAGWYRYSPTPGELGPAVIIGHVDSEAGPAVFHRLQDLTPGDVIRVHREDARVAEFIVDDVESFAKETFPTEQVYGDIDHAGLRLITCGGDYDRGAGGYLANTVVFATLAPS